MLPIIAKWAVVSLQSVLFYSSNVFKTLQSTSQHQKYLFEQQDFFHKETEAMQNNKAIHLIAYWLQAVFIVCFKKEQQYKIIFDKKNFT